MLRLFGLEPHHVEENPPPPSCSKRPASPSPLTLMTTIRTRDRIGLQAAEALGEPPERVLKTLMALVDGKPVCIMIPSDCEVSMKKLASAFGGKSAQMMKPSDAERMTGYKVGGISPFGQRRMTPVAMEEHALLHSYVFINAVNAGCKSGLIQNRHSGYLTAGQQI